MADRSELFYGDTSYTSPVCASTSSTPFPPVTLKSLTALAATLKPIPRDVFVFPGTLAEFKVAMEAQGMMIQSNSLGHPVWASVADSTVPGSIGMLPFGTAIKPIGAMECHEIDGEVWVAGNYRDIRDARDGKLAVVRIRGGSQ